MRKSVLGAILLPVCFVAGAADAKLIEKVIINARGEKQVIMTSVGQNEGPPERLKKEFGEDGWHNTVLKIDDETTRYVRRRGQLIIDLPHLDQIWGGPNRPLLGTMHAACVATYGSKAWFYGFNPKTAAKRRMAYIPGKISYTPGMYDAIVAKNVAYYDPYVQSLYTQALQGGSVETYYRALRDRTAKFLAYIYAESRYPCEVSSAGARSVGQVMDSSYVSDCPDIVKPNPYDPNTSIQCMVREIIRKETYFADIRRAGHVEGIPLEPGKPDLFYQAAIYNMGRRGWIGWLASRLHHFYGRAFPFASGLWSKERLLRHERTYLDKIIRTTQNFQTDRDENGQTNAWFAQILARNPGWKIPH